MLGRGEELGGWGGLTKKNNNNRRVKISQYSQENTCVGISFFVGVSKKRLQDRCFPVNIVKFLRKPILKNICEQLLLTVANQEGFLKDSNNRHCTIIGYPRVISLFKIV